MMLVPLAMLKAKAVLYLRGTGPEQSRTGWDARYKSDSVLAKHGTRAVQRERVAPSESEQFRAHFEQRGAAALAVVDSHLKAFFEGSPAFTTPVFSNMANMDAAQPVCVRID